MAQPTDLAITLAPKRAETPPWANGTTGRWFGTPRRRPCATAQRGVPRGLLTTGPDRRNKSRRYSRLFPRASAGDFAREKPSKAFCRFCQHVRGVFARKPAAARRASVSLVSSLQGHTQCFRDARKPSHGTRRRPACTGPFEHIPLGTLRAITICVRRGGLCWRGCQEVTCMD